MPEPRSPLPALPCPAAPTTKLSRLWARGRLLLSTLLLSLGLMALGLTAAPGMAGASLDNDRYDGNIYALYAGNGSLVPPRLSLAEALDEHRVTLLIYYLDDSAVSKRFAGVVSELQRVWGGSVEILPLVTDPLQGRADGGPSDPLHYWRGVIPQVAVLGADGQLQFEAAGQVDLAALHGALSRATGLPVPPSVSERLAVSFNELNDGWIPAPSSSLPHG